MPAVANNQASMDAVLSSLKKLKTKELQDLMDDSAKLDKMINQLDIIKKNEKDKVSQLASNKKLAEHNLSREPRLAKQCQLLADTYDKAVKVQKDFDRKKLKFDSSSCNVPLDTTFALLQTEAAKAEEESEICAETFLTDHSDVDNFVQRYIAVRTKAHLLKVKVDKMADIVNEKDRKKSVPNGRSKIH